MTAGDGRSDHAGRCGGDPCGRRGLDLRALARRLLSQGLGQKKELEFASRALSSIEVNGTFYGSQKRESFARRHDEALDRFVFAPKGPRYATNRR